MNTIPSATFDHAFSNTANGVDCVKSLLARGFSIESIGLSINQMIDTPTQLHEQEQMLINTAMTYLNRLKHQ